MCGGTGEVYVEPEPRHRQLTRVMHAPIRQRNIPTQERRVVRSESYPAHQDFVDTFPVEIAPAFSIAASRRNDDDEERRGPTLVSGGDGDFGGGGAGDSFDVPTTAEAKAEQAQPEPETCRAESYAENSTSESDSGSDNTTE